MGLGRDRDWGWWSEVFGLPPCQWCRRACSDALVARGLEGDVEGRLLADGAVVCGGGNGQLVCF
jgi:hypothetical protein